MSIEFAVVLLHYNTIEDTINIVEQFRRSDFFMDGRLEIMVVDNASPNGTGSNLKEEYEGIEHINVLLLKENLGYAKGNNVGYRIAYEKFHPDFIILSNTDILLKTDGIFEEIKRNYEETQFAILGPDIIKKTKNGTIHQNPKFGEKEITIKNVRKDMMEISIQKMIVNFGLSIKQIPLIRKTYGFIISTKNGLVKNRNISEPVVRNNKILSRFVMLHGAFLIFSREFIEKFPMGLSEETFMYGEEYFLAYYCQQEELSVLFQPEIEILHLEGNSTLSERSVIQRNSFLRKEVRKSLRNLIEIIKKDNIKKGK